MSGNNTELVTTTMEPLSGSDGISNGDIAMLIVMSIVALLSLVGNLLVISAAYIRQSLRTPNNLLLVNLALADLGQGVIAIPLRILEVFNRGTEPFVPCLIVLFITILFFGVSMITVALISTDRFIAIRYPFTYTKNFTRSIALHVMISTWVFMTVFAAIPFVSKTGAGITPSIITKFCFYSQYLSKAYLLTMFAIVNIFIIFVLLFTNTYLLKETLRHIKSIKAQVLPVRSDQVSCREVQYSSQLNETSNNAFTIGNSFRDDNYSNTPVLKKASARKTFSANLASICTDSSLNIKSPTVVTKHNEIGLNGGNTEDNLTMEPDDTADVIDNGRYNQGYSDKEQDRKENDEDMVTTGSSISGAGRDNHGYNDNTITDNNNDGSKTTNKDQIDNNPRGNDDRDTSNGITITNDKEDSGKQIINGNDGMEQAQTSPKTNENISTSTDQNSGLPAKAPSKHQILSTRMRYQREIKATKATLAVVSFTIVLTTPIMVIDLVSMWCPMCSPPLITGISVAMAYANACVNPWIFAGFIRVYRQTYIIVLKRIRDFLLCRKRL